MVLLSLIPGKEGLYPSRKSEFLSPCNCGWGRKMVPKWRAGKRFLLFGEILEGFLIELFTVTPMFVAANLPNN